MIKKVAYILATLAVFYGCDPSISPEETYSISGEIIDPNASLDRLLADMHVSATDNSTGKTYPGLVGTEDAVTCRYSLDNLPSGDYLLRFSSSYYEPAEYSLTLQGNKTMNVTLTPIPLFSLDAEELYFAPRVTTRTLSVTNLTKNPVSLTLAPSGVGFLVQRILGCEKIDGLIEWRCQLDAEETKTVTVEIKHDDEESLLEGSLTIGIDGMKLSSIPLVIETTSRDFYANLVGRVTDNQGNPLKEIPIYCNCTDSIVLTDEEGRYSFDELPYVSQVQVIALPEFYNRKMSESKEYVRDEIVIDLTLEPCQNHLILDRKEIDFGTGSVSQSSAPVSFEINLTAETDVPVMFRVETKVLGGDVYPGLNYTANGMIESSMTLKFQLDRSVANVGDYQFTAILTTDCAGVYFIPIRFTNTE